MSENGAMEVVNEDKQKRKLSVEEGVSPPPKINKLDIRDSEVTEVDQERKEEARTRAGKLGDEFLLLLAQEGARKRLTVATSNLLVDIKGRYDEIIGELLAKSERLEGRLDESRKMLLEFRGVTKVAQTESKKAVPKNDRGGEENAGARRKSEGVQKRIEGIGKGGAEVFVEVKGKKPRRRGGKGKSVREEKKDKVAKVEKAKTKEPPKTFIVSKGESGSEEAKGQLWSQIASKVKCPKLAFSRVLPRGTF